LSNESLITYLKETCTKGSIRIFQVRGREQKETFNPEVQRVY